MSLLSDYHKEQGLRHVIESESGFVIYQFLGEECYILDAYVVPDKRRTGLCFQMADQVAEHAKSRGCKYLTASAIPQANNPTRSIQTFISYGMKLIRAESTAIYFGKEI